ncbi:MAG: hypothetical protein VB043_07055 [Petrimonas sp.]|nr:hypothetical protein [Petrimonas sp.]
MAPLPVFVRLSHGLRAFQTFYPPVCFIRYGAFDWSGVKAE